MRVQLVGAVLLGASLVAAGLGGWSRAARHEPEPIPFERTRMYIEYNATAGDVGMQVSMDGEPWKQLKVFGPDGRLIMEVTGRRSLSQQGFTELFFESSEPPLDEVPLSDFLRKFPAGEYEFEGITIEGQPIEGVARFTHAIPREPAVLTPQEGSVQDPENTVVRWLAVPNPAGSVITAYQVTVTQVLDVFPERVFSVHVPAGTERVTVPPEFLQHGADYGFEVLAIEAGGNQTIHAGSFSTAP